MDFQIRWLANVVRTHIGCNHDGVNVRRGIVSHGLWEEKSLLELQGWDSYQGLCSRTPGEHLPLLMCLKIRYEITTNTHVQLLSQ